MFRRQAVYGDFPIASSSALLSLRIAASPDFDTEELIMIYSNVLLTVKNEGDIDKVRELLVQQGTLSKQEPGCARFEVYHSKNQPTLFMLVERWESQEHLDRHREAKAYLEIYQPQVLPLVDRVPHPSDLVF